MLTDAFSRDYRPFWSNPGLQHLLLPASVATPFRKDAVSRRNQRSALSPERLIVFFPEVLSVARESWSTVDLESRCI